MIFRQLFDSVSGTYSYLLASRAGGEALILDPVLEKADRYCQLLRELDLRLVKAVDTHLHADHVTGLGELRDRTQCITIMGEQSKADVVSMRVSDGDKVMIEGLSLDVMYTPGHTDNSYSYLMGDRVFTGDTLLIRGTGRTDFQNGSSRAQYESIFNRLLKLPDETMVFPAHDYKGDTVSTIGEERRYNPRLQVRSVDEYIELMANLKLPNPKMMDVAVPANMHVGLHQEELAKQGLALSALDAIKSLGRPDILLVDLREASERAKHGTISGALHAPYPGIAESLQARRHAARSRRRHRPPRGVLLRLRRTLRDGGSRREECGAGQHRAYRRRYRRVEEGRWAGGSRVVLMGPSSLRTQGPIRRGADDGRQWPTSRLSYNILWLWVPAFAGTTRYLYPDLTAPPAATPPSARRAHPPAARRRIRSCVPESRCAFPADRSAPAPDAAGTPGPRPSQCRRPAKPR